MRGETGPESMARAPAAIRDVRRVRGSEDGVGGRPLAAQSPPARQRAAESNWAAKKEAEERRTRSDKQRMEAAAAASVAVAVAIPLAILAVVFTRRRHRAPANYSRQCM